MTRIEFLRVFGYFLVIVLPSLLAGTSLIKLITKISGEQEEKSIPPEFLGAGLIIGLGITGYLTLIAGLLGHFTKPTLLLVLAGLTLTSVWIIPRTITSLILIFKNLFKELKVDISSAVAVVLSILTLGTLYLAAMQPPHATDELHYHLPEVREIVTNERVDLSFGGHPFYGNIPKLMEIIFAVGKTISSYQLSHALNFAVLVGFLLVIFGLIKRHYGLRAASLSVLLISWFTDFTWNASTAFIDAATTAFEISALLFILDWTRQKSRVSFFLSAILIGIAVSMKYSPLPTAVFILCVITFKLYKDHQMQVGSLIKTILPYLLTSVLFGGFWYIKNLVKLGNPFYPLYFGHVGYDEVSFKSLMDAIHEFGPKTPAYFYKLTRSFSFPTQFFVFLSIYLSPAILFLKKEVRFRYSLFIYFLSYTLYWFFFATHQVRFLTSALIVSIIILSILISRVQAKTWTFTALVLFLILFANKEEWNTFWADKFHLVERQYALGNVTETQFLTWKFGCQYSVIKYLEGNNLEGSVIDNWSVWFAPSVSFYSQKNHFLGYGIGKSGQLDDIMDNLKAENIRYVYFDSKIKESFLKSTDPIVFASKNSKLPAETFILKHSELIYQNDRCNLYEIKF